MWRNEDKESVKGRICCATYHIRLVVFLVDFAPAKPSHNSLKRDLALFVSQNNIKNNFRVLQTEIRTSKLPNLLDICTQIEGPDLGCIMHSVRKDV